VTQRRRGHGEGSIYRRSDGRWAAMVDLGWHDGKRRRKFLCGTTRSEVARKLSAALKALQEGQGPAGRAHHRRAVPPGMAQDRRAVASPAHLDPLRAAHPQACDAVPRQAAAHQARPSAPGGAVRGPGALGPVQDHCAATAPDPPSRPARRQPLEPSSAGTSPNWSLRRARPGTTSRRSPPSRRAASSTPSRAIGWRRCTCWRSRPACGKASCSACGGRRSTLGGNAVHLVKHLKTSTSRRQVLLVSVAAYALTTHRIRQDEERRRLGAAWDDQDLVFPNTAPPAELPAAVVLPAARSRWPAAHPLPRPAPQCGDAAAWARHPPQDRERAARPQPGRYHTGPILPRHSYHAAGGRAAFEGLLGSQLGGQPDAPQGNIAAGARSSVG
jgi:hypothetical protein